MRAFLSSIALLTLLSISSAGAEEWGPWEVPQQQKQQSANILPLQLAVRAFQTYISPVDGPRCPMYPTCSSYSLQAMRKHGPLIGVFQTVDRLYREGDGKHEHRHPIEKWEYVRFADPLKNNDFWLQKR